MATAKSHLQLWMLRNYDAANKTIDRALALDPTAMEPLGVKSQLAIAEKGDFSVAERGFETLKSIPMTNEQKLKTADARTDVFLLERRYRRDCARRKACRTISSQVLPWPCGASIIISAFARRALQDEPGARAAFLRAKSAVEEQLKYSPDNAKLRIQLAKVLAFLGEKDPALAEARRASELQPESKDALEALKLRKVWPRSTPFLATTIGDRNSGRTVKSAQLRHCAESESKSDLGSIAKRSAFSGFDRQARHESLASSSVFTCRKCPHRGIRKKISQSQ